MQNDRNRETGRELAIRQQKGRRNGPRIEWRQAEFVLCNRLAHSVEPRTLRPL